jgi:hypothetical protein
MSARAALDALLAEWGGADDADEALVDYISSVIGDSDGDDDDGLVEQLMELLAEVAPRFKAAPTAVQVEATLDLIQVRCAGRAMLHPGYWEAGIVAERPPLEAPELGCAAIRSDPQRTAAAPNSPQGRAGHEQQCLRQRWRAQR